MPTGLLMGQEEEFTSLETQVEALKLLFFLRSRERRARHSVGWCRKKDVGRLRHLIGEPANDNFKRSRMGKVRHAAARMLQSECGKCGGCEMSGPK